ncbi:MAG: 3-deoxy-7-phosphoheptulonate synthase [Epulopiscium sp. Nele67-Bin005]|nr:MAG: 3-deoxy-7-phosphoheptulonate synthase [Epulopiscium sp. Nele67-Bin005]
MSKNPLFSLAYKSERTQITLPNCTIGGDELVVIAGPCAIESEEQLMKSGEITSQAGAKILRGGAYKPRTSPYAFQGLEVEGLKIMKAAGEKFGMSTVCEVTSEKALYDAIEYVDIIQIGARNMQNFELLKAVGKTDKVVILKRGLSATIDEWLNASEYILSGGNMNVILCERGIRTYETATRNTLDLSAIPVIRSKSHLPIVVDPSHATGKRDYIEDLAKASVAVGADALMIEVHPNPDEALSDGPQSLDKEDFQKLMDNIRPIAEAVGRKL